MVRAALAGRDAGTWEEGPAGFRAEGGDGGTGLGTEGMALPLMLLLLLALTALGHGALLLSMRELQATWAFRHAVRAGEAAQAGAWLAIQEGVAPPEDRAPWAPNVLVSGETSDGVRYGAVLRWLDGELFLLEGIGGSRGWVGERRMGWTGWSLLPPARLGAFKAAAEVGGGYVLVEEARAESGAFLAPPDGWPEASCSGYREVLDSLFPGGPLPILGGLPDEPPHPSVEGDSIPPLGLLSGTELLERAADAIPSGVGFMPGDSVRGCPERSEPPVFQGTSGSLHLDGGRLCGILVALGDLRLTGEARVQGLVLVGGDLIMEDGAVLEGMARVRGVLRLGGSALFRSSACPVLWALENLSVLQEPILLPGGSRINGF